MPAIEVLARGVLVDRGHVLLATPAKETYAFLPGGHVEFGEAAPRALARELTEELGVSVAVGPFLGAVEHAFSDDDGQRHAEINLIFRLACAALTRDRLPPSLESHIAFLWQPLEDLGSVHLQPQILRLRLPQWLAAGHAGGWASTIEQER
jgi:8-oxo-dGTP pyrophosphatase MutT (NUDIX family)